MAFLPLVFLTPQWAIISRNHVALVPLSSTKIFLAFGRSPSVKIEDVFESSFITICVTKVEALPVFSHPPLILLFLSP